jgi:hypothetical protein
MLRCLGAVYVDFRGKSVMLLVITSRSEGSRYAENHIADSDCTRMFCGEIIPPPVIECGLSDPRNPYVGKGVVTCKNCLSEHKNGRRSGFREQ